MIIVRAVDLIIKKKQKQVLSKEEIHFLIDGYVHHTIPDYQMSAFLMAVCLNGLTSQEQVDLTMEMLYSGEVVDLSSIDGMCVDKHSTGGVGDKTTLIIAPMVAACGLKMAKMSGRGLGHTGGTIDKLESIPGFRVSIDSQDFYRQVREIGLAVIGQTANIAPADKKLYALRDVTGTVESVGLIAGSIMSKKLASGSQYILLDVKVGDGAFMKSIDDARILARAMVDIGNNLNRKTVAVLTDMDEPLGNMVGNSLEVIEAIETLKGKGPTRLYELCLNLSAHLLLMTQKASDFDSAKSMIHNKVTNGEALEKLREMITYQGGNPSVIDDYRLFASAADHIEVKAKTTGYIQRVEALKIGLAAMVLGAGREQKEDIIDMGVGVEVIKKVGDFVHQDETLAIIYTNGKNTKEAYQYIIDAYHLTSQVVLTPPIILDIVE